MVLEIKSKMKYYISQLIGTIVMHQSLRFRRKQKSCLGTFHIYLLIENWFRLYSLKFMSSNSYSNNRYEASGVESRVKIVYFLRWEKYKLISKPRINGGILPRRNTKISNYISDLLLTDPFCRHLIFQKYTKPYSWDGPRYVRVIHSFLVNE